MITLNKYTNEIKKNLLEIADDKTKEKALMLASGAKSIGEPVPKIRSLVKEFKHKYPDLTIEDACMVMDNLCKDKDREELLFGIFLISSYNKNTGATTWTKINSWVNALDNWETCDQLSSNIAGIIIANNIFLIDKPLSLAQSSNLWKRRFTAATATNINHGGRHFPEQTLAICKPLLNDNELMVTKAVGWAIREISKNSPDMVFDFLKANKKNISEKLLKESSEKLNINQIKVLKIKI